MRVRPPRQLFAFAFGALLAAWAARGHAQVPETRALSEPPPPFVFGSALCPDPKAVQQAVLSLVPPERQKLLTRGVRVELEDLGDSYKVSVSKDGSSVKKSYSDPARDCDGRVRFAAVFAVLTWMPPELGLEPVVKPEPEPIAPPAPTPKAKPRAASPAPALPPLVHVELSALYAAAPAILDASSSNSLGAELRVALGRAAIAGTLSIAYLQRAKFELNGVQGELERLPVSIGLRLHSDFDPWVLDADLGLLLVAQRVHASNLLMEQSHRTVDVGARVGAQIARQFGPHFAPFVGAFAWLSPAPRELSVLPQGAVGNLPHVWLGGAAGVSLGM